MLPESFLLFVVTTFVVVLSPGPAAIAVASESARGGFARGSMVILGIAIANTVYFVLSATGISALILASNVLFSVIKWVGVAYLIWIGIQALRSRGGPLAVGNGPPLVGGGSRSFARGFILEMSNPKALIYFAALLPQFIDPTRPVLQQFVVFGLITFLIDIVVYGCYAWLGRFSARSELRPAVVTVVNRFAGGLLIFAGLRMATVER